MIVEIGKEYKGPEIGQLLEELSEDELHKNCVIDVAFFLDKSECKTCGRIISEIFKTAEGYMVSLIPFSPGPCDWGKLDAFWTDKEGVTDDKTISNIKVRLVSLRRENKNIKRQNSPIEIGKEYKTTEIKTLLSEIFEKGLTKKFVFDVTYFVEGAEITTNSRNMSFLEKTEDGFYIIMTPNRPKPDDVGEFEMAWFEENNNKENGTITMLKIISMVA